LVAALTLLAGAGPASAATKPQDRLFLARPYPIEAAPSFPGGLYHWIDSLAGTSGAKTIPAHRAEYLKLFGPMNDDDKTRLRAFVAARSEFTIRQAARTATDGAAPHASAMLGVFCTSATVDDAIARVRPDLTDALLDGLASALAHFGPRYELVWNHGARPEAFLERARRDPGRSQLTDLLTRIVRFYGVDPLTVPPPRLALVPVPAGFGTHAEAVGGVLLLEIREGDRFADEASVVVHENAHFLWSLVPVDRQRRLARAAADLGDEGSKTFALLREAIPTALGQGIADDTFRPGGWSLDTPWYHTPEVDRCAKRIYPVLRAALDSGGVLDETLIRRVIAAASGPR
jgi:hypothetical protein